MDHLLLHEELNTRFFFFQESLAEMRKVDDKIIYALNTSIPTESFKGQLDPVSKCRELHMGLQNAYIQRQTAIKTCIVQSADLVKKLREQNEGDVELSKSFKAEQRKVSGSYHSLLS